MTVGAGNEKVSFRPPPGLRNAHLQSLLSRLPWHGRSVARRAAGLIACAERLTLDCGDDVRLAGFLSRATGKARGLVILLHGWEGCADSSYILSAGAGLHAAGFDVFRLNLRDHGDTHGLNEELFHSCRIDEVVNAVARLQQILEPARLVLVGQSLGGNFAVRVAVRGPGRQIDIDRVLAVGPVLNPVSTMRALEEGLWIYRHYFLRRWRQSLYRKAALFPSLYEFGDLSRFSTLTETTEFFVRHYTDFGSLDAYLNGYAITGDRLQDLSVSCRLILAGDDPVIPAADVAVLARPEALEIDITEHGGHCGFVEDFGMTSWVDRQILEDLSARF